MAEMKQSEKLLDEARIANLESSVSGIQMTMNEMKSTNNEMKSTNAAVTAMLEKIMANQNAAADERIRYSRVQESRDFDPVHETYDGDDEPYGLLDNPALKARPGFRQMWIRTHVQGDAEGANVARMFNRGWRPRAAETLPKDVMGSCTVDFEGSSVVGWRGTILCEMPEEQHRKLIARREHHAKLQMRAVEENLFREHDRSQSAMGAPHFTERKRTVERGVRPAPVDL